MKKYYVPAIVALNNIHGDTINANNNNSNSKKNLNEVSKFLKNTYRYAVVYDELKITQSLNDYKELETYKVDTESEIKKINDEARTKLEAYYKEYQELMKNNASQSEQEACVAKIQKQTSFAENKIKIIQEDFQTKTAEKVSEIRNTVKRALEYICGKVAAELKKEHKSTDRVIVVAENKDNVLGLETGDLNSIDVTDFVIIHLEEKGKISTGKHVHNSAKKSNKKSNNSTTRNKKR